MDKCKIALYVDSLLPSGGKERVVANLLQNWNNSYSITLITKDEGESFYKLPGGINRISLSCPMKLNMHNRASRVLAVGLNLIVTVLRLRKTLEEIDYDYLYVSTPLNAFEAFLAMKNANKKLLVTEHASINAFNKLYSWMKKFVYPKAYCISVPNTMDTEEYKAWGCNAVYIPHLVTYEAVEKNELNSKILLNVGRLTMDKQQELLIRAWKKIKNKKGWKFWIVGDGEEHERLRQLVNELELNDSVSLMPARKDIQSVYKQASAFILASRSEGFGMVLLEAMSFGIPCISFDCPSGPRDIVKNGENGYLIGNQNVEELVQKMETLISMSDVDLKSMGNKAFETVVNWDNERILEQWDKVFS